MSVEALRRQLDAAEWAPVRLATGKRLRTTSPRLPHAIVLHLAAQAREALAAGADAESSIVSQRLDGDVRRLGPDVGADPEVVADILDALVAARILGRGHDGLFQLSSSLLGNEPRCATIDWRALAAATVGSPSAWVAAHVLAELLDAGDWTPVPRSALEHALGCGVSGTRAALDRLVTASVLERREQRGGVSVYRFAPSIQRRSREPRQPFAPRGSAAHGANVEATRSSAVDSHPRLDVGVVVSVGGVELELPPGLRARVEIGADGRPVVRIVGSQS
ncbi:MAG: hypothetical protein JO180_09260 [Gemmatirosa sp.]|nr:hypothetical protein [Gemmatirosa sp.]